MSASVLRTSIRRVAAINKRLYTTANPKNSNTGLLLGVVAAGAGYYLYKKSAETKKGSFEKKGEEIEKKYQETMANTNEKAQELKSAVNQKLEEAKSQASSKVEELKKQGTENYEATKQSAIEKDLQIQNKVGDKAIETGKDIKGGA